MLEILKQSPVIPVIVIDEVEDAVPLAHALIAGGIKVIEVTLRTPIALDAIKKIAQQVPGMLVGAGTILRTEQVKQAQAAGAKFGVSPGFLPSLVEAAHAIKLPYLPGAATASEIMQAVSLGLEVLKFFPVETLGGVKAVTAMHAVFPHVKFCVTGGVTFENMPVYLASPAIISVGSSWVAPRDLIKQKAWSAITELARKTIAALT